jgi:hypothetical protein
MPIHWFNKEGRTVDTGTKEIKHRKRRFLRTYIKENNSPL